MASLTVRLFGLELLHIETADHAATDCDEPGDCLTTGFGFVPSPGDQRWSEVDGVDE